MQTVVVSFSGGYDVAGKERLRTELDRLVSVPRLVLDLSDVTYMDSTAVTELIRMHRRRSENRFPRETIVLKSGNIEKLFDLLQLRKVFEIVASVDQVLAPGAQVSRRSAFSESSPVDPDDDSQAPIYG